MPIIYTGTIYEVEDGTIILILYLSKHFASRIGISSLRGCIHTLIIDIEQHFSAALTRLFEKAGVEPTEVQDERSLPSSVP